MSEKYRLRIEPLLAALSWLLFLLIALGPGVGTGKIMAEENPGPADAAGSMEVVSDFLSKLALVRADDIQSLSLSYDVHMEFEFTVKVVMQAKLTLNKKENEYVATFNLTKPLGKNLWSRFALYVYGKRTRDYKEMIKSVETVIQESMRLEAEGFRTIEFREILSASARQEGRSGMKVYFDYRERKIKFWEDKARQDFSRSMAYDGQVGPLTAFFNYILFEKPRTKMLIVNALRQTVPVRGQELSTTGQKRRTYIFDTQLISLHPNTNGRHIKYDNVVTFENENYLDIIYGRNIYHKLVLGPKSSVKVSSEVFLEGIISKSKMRKREAMLEELRQSNLDLIDSEFERLNIEAMDILAARNVRVRLRSADLELR